MPRLKVPETHQSLYTLLTSSGTYAVLQVDKRLNLQHSVYKTVVVFELFTTPFTIDTLSTEQLLIILIYCCLCQHIFFILEARNGDS